MLSSGSSRLRRRLEIAVALLAGAGIAVALLLSADPGARESQPLTERGQSDAGPASATDRAAGAERRVARPAGRRQRPEIQRRRSRAVGTYAAGRLERGVLLPAGGRAWVTWDPILKRRPNREWRRWGTDRLVRTTMTVLREFGRAHPRAPRVAVGDLSRPGGGDFGPQFGSIGHASHQNGLDVDVYYPRLDGRVRPPKRPGQVDLELAQDLVDRFVRAGAARVFVGPSLGLDGPGETVVPLVNHDNHLHARLPLD
jgi:Penicillin-insensitive murein endopeptidase